MSRDIFVENSVTQVVWSFFQTKISLPRSRHSFSQSVTPFVFAARCYASPAYAVMKCLSVRPSRSWILSKGINISSKLFHHRVATSLYFSTPNVLAIFRRGPANGSVECRWDTQKSRIWANSWLYHVLSPLWPLGVINRAPLNRGKLWHLSLGVNGVCWWQETTTKCLWQEVSTLHQRHRTTFNCTQW